MIRKTFKKHEVQTEFEENGFVVIKSALPSEKIDELSEFYYSNEDTFSNRNFDYPIDTSFEATNDQTRKEVAERIDRYLQPFIENYLDGYKSIGYNTYSVKHPKAILYKYHPHSFLIDIEKYRSVVCWLAMHDVDEHNGALRMVKNGYHGLELIEAKAHFGPSDSDFQEQTQKIPLQKGDLVVFDNMLKHGSSSNSSNKPRLGIVEILIPAEADLLHYEMKHTESNSFVDIYEFPNLIKYLYDQPRIRQEIKNLTPIKTIPYPKQVENTPQPSLFAKIKHFLLG